MTEKSETIPKDISDADYKIVAENIIAIFNSGYKSVTMKPFRTLRLLVKIMNDAGWTVTSNHKKKAPIAMRISVSWRQALRVVRQNDESRQIKRTYLRAVSRNGQAEFFREFIGKFRRNKHYYSYVFNNQRAA